MSTRYITKARLLDDLMFVCILEFKTWISVLCFFIWTKECGPLTCGIFAYILFLLLYYIKIDMDAFVNLDIKHFGGYCKNVWFALR